jgi:RNA polymerase sigma factor (sigma-70 family)
LTPEEKSFEECIDIIDEEIRKRKSKWNLQSLAWMDFEDVSQIIKIHINNKWHLYDIKQPLRPWLNRIISNQLKNLIRNNYGNFTRPCLKCAASEENDGCKLFKKQCIDCPLYEYWNKNKKDAQNLKIPVSMDYHSIEVRNLAYSSDNFESNKNKLHKKMLSILKPLERTVYQYIYIEHKSDEEVAKIMNYTTSEQGRPPGYKHLKNIKKSIVEKVKKILEKGDVDII